VSVPNSLFWYLNVQSVKYILFYFSKGIANCHKMLIVLPSKYRVFLLGAVPNHLFPQSFLILLSFYYAPRLKGIVWMSLQRWWVN